jgi:hypothetical protein
MSSSDLTLAEASIASESANHLSSRYHDDADDGASAARLRLVQAAPREPAVVHLSPSLVRMSAGARLGIAAALALAIWAATIAVMA